MVIDTSVLVALLLAEPEAVLHDRVIRNDTRRLLSAAVLLETTIVYLGRSRQAHPFAVTELISSLDASVLPVTALQAEIAGEAFRRFGKGRHPAKLNFGDCFSYVLAKAQGEPLLFKGNDFNLTDVRIVDWWKPT
ncbi:type II toxin-antitoxin system VapC family toxin [Terriglobus sp.]|uniref:type II toxin-antitoxin system VapC family toxin n=1 Tax=Terriglobus sp. TaxID=1889013 RepID=UPI003AFFA6DB